MMRFERLAFVDVETSGLSPRTDRITEIGVVTVDAGAVSEWTTLLNPWSREYRPSRFADELGREAVVAAPRFKDIAPDLAARLEGRLFIAHNARFDFGFLKSEFSRAGIEFKAQVVCSAMLSRKLRPQLAGHDLDSLMARHGLSADVRHRALPDAHLVWQFWQLVHSEHPQQRLTEIVDALLAGPVLPAHLDPSLIERLPEAPGVYVLHGDEDAVLHAGKAENLKLHVQNYFRIDRMSTKALAISHLVRNISWRATRGAIGAHLQLKALSSSILPARKKQSEKPSFSWTLRPDRYPCVELVARSPAAVYGGEPYGVFDSERKARNALARIAQKDQLCRALLGIRDESALSCTACDPGVDSCGHKTERLRHLSRAVVKLRPLRLDKWPYDGPIGVRERDDLHIIEDWCYLGTAQTEDQVHQVLETRRDRIDEDTFVFLARTLARLPSRRIVRLSQGLFPPGGGASRNIESAMDPTA